MMLRSHRDDKGWVSRVKHGSSDAEPPRTAAVRIINNMDQMRAETEDRGMRDEVTGDAQVGNGEEVEIFFRKMTSKFIYVAQYRTPNVTNKRND